MVENNPPELPIVGAYGAGGVSSEDDGMSRMVNFLVRHGPTRNLQYVSLDCCVSNGDKSFFTPSYFFMVRLTVVKSLAEKGDRP